MGVQCCNSKPQVLADLPKTNETIRAFQRSRTRRQSVLGTQIIKLSDYKNRFKFIKFIGEGSFGKVRLFADNLYPSLQIAIKSIKKENLSSADLRFIKEEVVTLSKLDHPLIVSYLDTYEDTERIHLCMEYIKGVDLSEYLKDDQQEKTVKTIIFTILKALNYLASFNVIHRDIKPSNILVPEGNLTKLKIIDFGLCTQKTGNLNTIVGSPFFMSPESINIVSTLKSDIWSVGVILYLFAFKEYPYNGKDRDEIFDLITNQPVNFAKKTKYSPECVKLIEQLLKKKENERISVSEALQHSWFEELKEKEKVELNQEFLATLQWYSKTNTFFKEVFKLTVKVMDEAKLVNIMAVFNRFDSDNKGYWVFNDFRKFLRKIDSAIEKEDVMLLFESVCKRKNDRITAYEIAAVFEAKNVSD